MNEVYIFVHNGEIYYRYNNNIYDINLDLDPSILADSPSNPYIPISRVIQNFTSKPIIVKFVTAQNILSENIITSTSSSSFNIITLGPFEHVSSILKVAAVLGLRPIPNPIQFQQSPRRLEHLDLSYLPPFDPQLHRTLTDLSFSGNPAHLNFNLVNAYSLQDLGMNYINFEQIRQILGSITRFEVNPKFQQFATPGNTVITLYTRSGLNYVVLARYDPATNQIFPPV